jgi:pimeloyl-ACP methyl ester carboxylesterase
MAGVTADIARYLQERRMAPAAVIGHSLGGVIGMRLARDHPRRVARLMIVDALPFIGTLFRPDATVDNLRPVAGAMQARMLAAAASPREPSPDDPNVATMSISAQGRRQVSAWGLAANPQVVAQALVEDMAEDLRPDLAAIAKVPTIVLYAVPPPIAAQARALWTAAYAPAPAIRLVPVENSFHFIMLDQPEAFAREVAAFLKR